ncbi:MAG: glutamine--fructose-6-phosphate transaminase (isomerizing) [Stappiaceae bacterium]
MCGIVGILGNSAVAPQLVDALKRLEYRGYDSAGVATLDAGKIVRCRAEGKLRNLEQKLERAPLAGLSGIGHTRWATHGAPTVGNAHPHIAPDEAQPRVAIVHNGIIENFRELREELSDKGAKFQTDTDTEVVAHLIEQGLAGGQDARTAVASTLGRLEGAFALAILISGQDDLMFGARKGSPLAIGYGKGEMYLGSDAIALAPFTDQVCYLEEGDWTILTRSGCTIIDEAGEEVERPVQQSDVNAGLTEKGNYRHFMAKEVHEQPEVIGHTLSRYLDIGAGTVKIDQDLPFDFANLSRIVICACGTAYYAGMTAKYWFERFARLPVDIDIASEFRYREMPMEPGGLALFISQSGETADTLASLRYCKSDGQHIGAVVNVQESTIARESDVIFPTFAGPEIGVASTKAFTCQLSVLASLAIAAGKQRGVLSQEDERKLVAALAEVPAYAVQALKLEPQIEMLARTLAKAKDVLYLGRGTSYPMAMEGALKLKEISYIHAEGYAAGELKHGPIALIDEHMPVVVIAPYDRIFDKTVSNMQEVAAREGRIILVTDEKGAEAAAMEGVETIIMPDMPATVTPIVYSIPIQLLAYHTAVIMGTDVDQPRNLAKSVTVE